jgi:thiosulfate/3-mercaptopyruvate sulfurtransferase
MIQSYQTLINADQLSLILNEESTVLLDCRYYLADITKGRKEYLQHHISGAYYMDIGLDLSSPVIRGVTGRHPLPHPEIIASTLRSAGIHNTSQVVVYDQSNGGYAARAWWLLKWLGHEHVALLNGGFENWKSKNLPLDNQWPPPKQGTFQIHVRDELTTSVHMLTSLKEHIIDSRDYKRYTGETEPIDPIAGHIPGAVCIPYTDNTFENGIWKSTAELSEKFTALQSGNNPPVFYCGSGVTACHNILAYKIATGQDARLYPGSWSEWINYYPAVTGVE